MSNLILIGFKHCGKTSVGQKLAQLKGLDFLDTDREIEAKYAQETGQTISCNKIYRTIGKEAFRNLEKNVIADLQGVYHTVIATGGGVIQQPENRTRLKQIGKVIYLSTPYETLLQRLKANEVPSFMQGDVDQEFAIMHTEREPLYSMTADEIIETENRTVDEIVVLLGSLNKQ